MYDIVYLMGVTNMKLSEVKLLLEENLYNYELTIVPSKSKFYRSKGLYLTEDTGAFYVITIPNPNHKMDIQRNC